MYWKKRACSTKLVNDCDRRVPHRRAVYAFRIGQDIRIEGQPHRLLVQFIACPASDVANWLREKPAQKPVLCALGARFMYRRDPCNRFTVAGNNVTLPCAHSPQNLGKSTVRFGGGYRLFHTVVILPTSV